MTGFRRFLMQGNVIAMAVGLVVALAFSNLVNAFAQWIVYPLAEGLASGGGAITGPGLGWMFRRHFIDVGQVVSAAVYFVIFMGVIYFALIVPYRAYMAHRGVAVFGDPAPTKTCPKCISQIPVPATRCMYCTSDLVPDAAG